MDAPDRDARAALSDALAHRARGASFFALVAHLERVLGGAPIGGAARAEDERIRLCHDPSLAFAPGDVAEVRVADGRAVVASTFLGLGGAVGPLPLFLREEIATEDPDRPIRRDLLDVFHHRALSLLYRGVRALRPDTTVEADAGDTWSARLLAIAGAARGPLTPAERIAVLPLLATRRRSALGLLAAVRILMRRRLGEGAPRVGLRELAGERTPLAAGARLRLGRAANALGRDAVLGGRALDPASRVVIEVHDVDPGDEVRLRPGGDLHALIVGVFQLFDPGAAELDLELHLREHRAFALGEGAPLGRRTRIASRPATSSVRFAARATAADVAR